MQHLQEMGLKLKPSFAHYYKIRNIDSGNWYLTITTGDISKDNPTYQYIPAYTLQDVLDALPKNVLSNGKYYYLNVDLNGESIYYGTNFGTVLLKGILYRKDGCLIDAAYTLLCWAIENGYVETNKNE